MVDDSINVISISPLPKLNARVHSLDALWQGICFLLTIMSEAGAAVLTLQ